MISTRRHGLRFSPKTHRYTLDGKPVPGVTSILNAVDKPALKKWAAAQVAEWVVDHPHLADQIAQAGGREPFLAYLKEVPWQKRDDAGTRGNILHDYAEQLLNGEEVEVHEEHVPVIEGALAFMDDWHIEPLLVEFPCASREHRWAGTGDLIARYRRPDTGHQGTAIFDWKSGKAIYPEYAVQLSAYANAEFSGLDGDEHPLPNCDAAFGVHIRPDGYDVYPFEFGPHVYDEFLLIRQLHDVIKRMRGDWKVPGSGYVGAAVQGAA